MDLDAITDAYSHSRAPLDDWRNLIRNAPTEEEVIGLVLGLLATWSPEEIARLPTDCRPVRIRDAEDISQWAFELASTHCGGKIAAEDEHLLDRMLELVTQAAVRLSVLNAAEPEGPLN